MSAVLTAFLATWSAARQTFGHGTPQPGVEFDQSALLGRLQSQVVAADPAPRWSGGGADAYAAVNTRHAELISRLADLDRQLRARVDRSAAIVSDGRDRLDAVRGWVTAAAVTVPAGPAGEQMMIPVVRTGLAGVETIVQQSNADLGTVGADIARLAEQYRLLGNEAFKEAPAGEPQTPAEDEAGDRRESLEEVLRRNQVSEDPDGMVEWEPGWPLNMFTDPKEMTATEAAMLDGLKPWELRDFQQISDAARAEANSRFPPPEGYEVDNHNDAYRHAYWNALMTQRFGEDWAEKFTTAHERIPDNYASSEAMDLHNNQVGRAIAAANPDATAEQLGDMVEQAVRNGDTVVIRPDGAGLEWSDRMPVGGPGGDSSVSVPVGGHDPGAAPTPYPDPRYDPGEPG